jgi:hypothetical protein
LQVPTVLEPKSGDLPVKTEAQIPVLQQPVVDKKLSPEKKIREFDVSPAVGVIIGQDDDKNDYNARVKAIRTLTRRISGNDLQALRMFLNADSDVRKVLKPLEFNGVKNDILGVLLRQDEVPEGLGRQVVEMYRDAQNDDVWRDYCVQYMAACYDGAKPTGVETNEPDVTRREIQKAYWDALAETGKAIAGTALIAVEQLSRDHTEFDRKKVEETALALAMDERCVEASRITALRICGMMGKKDVMPVARVLAQTGETVPLRLAAVATIGDLGEEQDVELLRSMAAGSEKRIIGVASSAVSRLVLRIAGKK